MKQDEQKSFQEFLELFAQSFTILDEIRSCEKENMEKLIKNINDGGQMTTILNNFSEIADGLRNFADLFDQAEKSLIDAANQKRDEQ